MDLEKGNNFNKIEKAALSAVLYYDMFDYPLDVNEIYKWLYFDDLNLASSSQKVSLSDIKSALESGNLKKYIKNKNGFYFLKSRENLLEKRRERHLIAQPKWKKAIWVAKILRVIPFVRVIAICNNLAYNNASKDSDIDYFIVCKRSRIWTTRLLVTILTSLMGVRRHGGKITDRICLSFYITERALNLKTITIDEPDVHFMYWFSQISPIFSVEKYDQELFQHNFSWMSKYLPNLIFYQGVEYERKVEDRGITRFLRKIFEKALSGKLGNGLENLSRKMQLKKMEKNYQSARWQDNTNVVVNNDILKFHEGDTRQQNKKTFFKKLAEISA